MSTPSRAVRAEELLEHMHWVQALARSMIRDPGGADDVAQDACLRALADPPRATDASSLRAWLARVARNLAREARRAAKRRTRRERHAARAESEVSTFDIVARGELQRRLVEAVMRLDEPHRSTILFRYLDQLSTREIARRTGATDAAVRQRVSRGLRALREDLERRRDPDDVGSVERWMLALAIPSGSGVETAPHVTWNSIGVWIVNTKLKLALAVGAVVALAALWITLPLDDSSFPDGRGMSAVALAEPAARERAPVDAIELRASQPSREASTNVPPAAADVAPPVIAPASTRFVDGIVVDVLASPVAGVEVVYRGVQKSDPLDGTRVRSGGDGRFRIEVGNEIGALRVDGAGWTTVFEPRTNPPDPIAGHVLVVARPRALSGSVSDGVKPLAGAQVAVELPGTAWLSFGHGGRIERTNTLRARFPLPLDSTSTARWQTTTDAQGAFSIPNAPQIAGARLVTTASGYVDDSRELTGDTDVLGIVLQPRAYEPGQLRGRVVDARGDFVSASVVLGDESTSTDFFGGFEIDARRAPDATALIVFARGRPPLVQPRLGSSATGPGAWPEPLVLTLADKNEAGAICGRVVDAHGLPVPEASVTIVDPTTLDRMLARVGSATLATKAVRAIETCDRQATCDADGRFELSTEPLARHRLRALDPRSLASTETDFVSAGGDDIEIRIEAGARYERLAGEVVDPRGAPIAGARVRARGRIDGEDIDSRDVETDAQGRFELAGIARSASALVVTSDWGADRVFSLAASSELDALVLVAGLPGHLRVEITTHGLTADTMSVLDERGERLPIGSRQANVWLAGHARELVDGKSEAFLISEDARTLVLHRGGTEVSRLPIRITPGQVNVVRP